MKEARPKERGRLSSFQRSAAAGDDRLVPGCHWSPGRHDTSFRGSRSTCLIGFTANAGRWRRQTDGGGAHRRRSFGSVSEIRSPRSSSPISCVGGGRPRRSVVAPTVGVRRPDVHHRPKLRFDGIAGAAGRLTSPRARMWLGEAPISLMLETSLIHPHTIVSMLINDLADNGNEVFLFLDDYHLVTDPAIRGAVSFLLRYAHRIFTWSLQHAWSHRYRFADCLPRTGCSRSIPLTCALTTPSQGRSRLVALAFIRRAPTAR